MQFTCDSSLFMMRFILKHQPSTSDRLRLNIQGLYFSWCIVFQLPRKLSTLASPRFRATVDKTTSQEQQRIQAWHSMDKREKSVYLSEIEFSGLKLAKTSKTRLKKCFY